MVRLVGVGRLIGDKSYCHPPALVNPSHQSASHRGLWHIITARTQKDARKYPVYIGIMQRLVGFHVIAFHVAVQFFKRKFLRHLEVLIEHAFDRA